MKNSKAYHYFCKHYNAQARPSRQPLRIAEPVHYTTWRDDPYLPVHNVKDVAAVDITLPEEEFGNLIDIFEELQNPQSDWSQFEYYKKRLGSDFISRAVFQLESTEKEQRIREQVPALKKAWENYQILLNISKDTK